jgi:hypothetical protein
VWRKVLGQNYFFLVKKSKKISMDSIRVAKYFGDMDILVSVGKGGVNKGTYRTVCAIFRNFISFFNRAPPIYPQQIQVSNHHK